MDPPQTPLFRQEALEQRAQAGSRGTLLRMSPAWTRWSYWIVVALVGAGSVNATLGHIVEYPMGPARIRAEGRREISARLAGTIAAVAVGPGQRVRAGQALVRFHDADEAADLDRIQREFDLQLIKMLRDPTD